MRIKPISRSAGLLNRYCPTGEHGLVIVGFVLAATSTLFAAHAISVNTGRPRVEPILPPADQIMTWKRGVSTARFRPPADPDTTDSIRVTSHAKPLDNVVSFERAQPDSRPRAQIDGDHGSTVAAPPRFVILQIEQGAAVVKSETGVHRVAIGGGPAGRGPVDRHRAHARGLAARELAGNHPRQKPAGR
jgi:hypothetical protein